jgi:hypothetical protein
MGDTVARVRQQGDGWSRARIVIAVVLLVSAVGCVPPDPVRSPPSDPSSAVPRPTAMPTASPAAFDPAKDLAATPLPRLIYFRAPCPAEPCERQAPPMIDEGKRFATNNYFVGFDGTWGWELYAGWTLADDVGTFRLYRHDDGFHVIAIRRDAGTPTLTLVSSEEALFVTSAGRRGILDLRTLKVTLVD